MCGAALVKINGAAAAFRPYEAEVENLGEFDVSLVLTRQNTFGELHVKEDLNGSSPEAFIPSGQAYQSAYKLMKQGLEGLKAFAGEK